MFWRMERALEDRFPFFDRSRLVHGRCAHGDGWYDILEELFTKLKALEPQNFYISQVEEDAGLLKVYVIVEGTEREVHAEGMVLARGAMRKSAHICELCGNPGTWLSDGHPRTTRCSPCRNAQK